MVVFMPEFDHRPVVQALVDEGLEPLILVVTGSHSWGLQRPESDIDLRGAYGWSTERALGLRPGRDNKEHVGEVLDFQVYEIKKLLGMLCASNGNVVEMLHNPLIVYMNSFGLQLKEFGAKAVTQQLADYYRGYATSQRKRAGRNRGAKALVYTMREMYAGIHLMAEGEIVFDFRELWEIVENRWFHSEVLAWAMENRNTPVSDDKMDQFEKEWDVLVKILERERANSFLPEKLPARFFSDANTFLLDYRRRWLTSNVW